MVLKVSGLPVWMLSEAGRELCFSQIKEAQKGLWLPLLGLRCLQAIVALMPLSWVIGPFSSVLSPVLFQEETRLGSVQEEIWRWGWGVFREHCSVLADMGSALKKRRTPLHGHSLSKASHTSQFLQILLLT